jgi:hypothetical protein
LGILIGDSYSNHNPFRTGLAPTFFLYLDFLVGVRAGQAHSPTLADLHHSSLLKIANMFPSNEHRADISIINDYILTNWIECLNR